jgi:hypothetical protein
MPAGAAIGAGASLLGGVLGGKGAKKAAKKAAAAQTAAANAAIGEERRQFDLTRSDFMPYLDEGKQGLGGLGDLVGINGGDKQGSAIEALQASPYYQSLYRNGLEANLQNASATGGIRGGNEVRSLADFGADTLNQTIQQQLSALAGWRAWAMGATNSVSNFGQNAANNIASLNMAKGQAQAGNYLTQGGITSQKWNNAGSALGSILGGKGGGGGMLGSIGPF